MNSWRKRLDNTFIAPNIPFVHEHLGLRCRTTSLPLPLCDPWEQPMTIRALSLAASAAVLLASAGIASAQQQSCTSLRQECVRFNSEVRADTSRCFTYFNACMRAGEWHDRRRSIRNVRRS